MDKYSRKVKGFREVEKGPIARGTAGIDAVGHTLSGVSATETAANQQESR